ncbi:MAG TPA: SDR family oxidoreductase [Gaiellaceae bacterium]|nr:SDR family oxidoreductase [Gaiellaceae bacterium]
MAGRIAIVTGGGSGIGEALCRALAARGDTVVVADLNEDGARRVAGDLGATAAGVDVRDAVAVAQIVEETVSMHGRLDLIFNNAGIGIGGDLLELGLAHWDRAIDVNLRGVVHGVMAAYPVMARQRSGHIVNTASIGGLIAPPYLTPYVATKHAVVGLSLALRSEAVEHGVGVTVVCPGWTDTPILDSTGPDDLPKPSSAAGGVRASAEKMGKLYPPARLAEDVLRAVDRNKAMVVTPRSARVLWRIARASPVGAAALFGRQGRADQRAKLSSTA